MVFRKSSRVAPSTSEFSLDFLADLGLEEPTSTASSSTLLFSSTAPAILETTPSHRTAEDIYADILGVEASFSNSTSTIEPAVLPIIKNTKSFDGDNGDNAKVVSNNSINVIKRQTNNDEKQPLVDMSIKSNGGSVSSELVNEMPLTRNVKDKTPISSIDNTLEGGMGDREKDIKPKVKGVSTGAMHVAGLTDSLKTKNDITMKFPCSPFARGSDIRRIAQELSFGIYVSRSLPWVSIESTNDRGASRVVALHPAYRNTLTGFVFTEIDTALKAVGGTAKGGLFLSCSDRDNFLTKECDGRDWGPNGQRAPPPHLIDANHIKAKYPSFTFSDEIFKTNEVSDWRIEWERVWSGDTGMDIQGTLSKLELIGDSEVHVHSDWRVSIHDDGGTNENIKQVRDEGEALCCKLLPSVPIPTPCDSELQWMPPEECCTLQYLFELLKVVTGIATLFESARVDHPSLLPVLLSNDYMNSRTNIDMSLNVKKVITSTRIPFEPSVDRETNSLFLGGGVGIAAVPDNVLRRKRRAVAASSNREAPSFTASFVHIKNDDCVLHNTQLHVEKACSVFYHQVVALGLWGNYSSSHPWIPNPKSNSQQPQLAVEVLVEAIHCILPDGYSKRLKKSCSDILSSELNRADASELYIDKHTIKQDIAATPAVSKGGKSVKAKDVLQIQESVELFNGDTYDGGWRLGRRHGKGVYVFASGSRYEGEWKEGEMAGWGIYITEDGTRRNIRHK